MDEFLLFLQVAGVIGIWAVIFWLARLIGSLKNGIAAQESVINSMASQAGYVSNLHETVSKLYNPNEIQNLVEAKTQSEISRFRSTVDDITKKSDKSTQSLYKFVGASVAYLNESQLKSIFSHIDLDYRSSELEKFAFDLRKEIESIRSEAIGKTLGGV